MKTIVLQVNEEMRSVQTNWMFQSEFAALLLQQRRNNNKTPLFHIDQNCDSRIWKELTIYPRQHSSIQRTLIQRWGSRWFDQWRLW